MRIIGEGLTFDDVLIVPAKSSVFSRRLVDTTAQLTKNVTLRVPVISAAMDTVTESAMATAMARSGGLGVIHRFMRIEDQCAEVLRVKNVAPHIAETVVNAKADGETLLKETLTLSLNGAAVDKENRLLCSAAVGVKDTKERSAALLKAGCDVLCIDVAHGHSDRVINAVREIRKEFGDVDLIAGNVATYEGAEDLITAGVDCVKVGIGPGSTCTTRLVTGCGVPQLTAIQWCVEACEKYGATMIADGGMRKSGDLVKVLAAGAHAGMFGGMFAGTDEAPSVLVIENDKKFKITRGMASSAAMIKNEQLTGDAKHAAPEGVEIYAPYQGSIAAVLKNLSGSLRSAMSYCGAHNLAELRQKAKFIRVSHATHTESAPHSDFFV